MSSIGTYRLRRTGLARCTTFIPRLIAFALYWPRAVLVAVSCCVGSSRGCHSNTWLFYSCMGDKKVRRHKIWCMGQYNRPICRFLLGTFRHHHRPLYWFCIGRIDLFQSSSSAHDRPTSKHQFQSSSSCRFWLIHWPTYRYINQGHLLRRNDCLFRKGIDLSILQSYIKPSLRTNSEGFLMLNDALLSLPYKRSLQALRDIDHKVAHMLKLVDNIDVIYARLVVLLVILKRLYLCLT